MNFKVCLPLLRGSSCFRNALKKKDLQLYLRKEAGV